jgi:hypothetical protein
MTGGPRLSVAEAAGRHTASGAVAMAGCAGFLAWAEWVVAALFLFLNFAFCFFYLIQNLI